MPGVTHKRDTDRDPDATEAPEVDQEQDAADQQVAVRESHGAIEREDLPDERGESPEVDAQEEIRVDPTLPAKRGLTMPLGGSTHTVVRSDTLIELAKATYGHSKYWKRIREANPGKVAARRDGTRDLLHTGDELVLPVIEVAPRDALEAMSIKDPTLKVTERGDDGAGLTDVQLLAMLEVTTSTGMTYPEMVQEQKRFWEEQAAALGLTVGEYLEQTHRSTIGNKHSTERWAKEEDHQDEWLRRFYDARDKVKAESRPEVIAAINEMEASGGEIIWEPERVERRNAFATGFGGIMMVGMDWVMAAEADVERVAASVLHEMVGHGVFGRSMATNVTHDAFHELPQEERDKTVPYTVGGINDGYWEYEIFAELYEFTYDSESNFTDHPFEVDPDGNRLVGEQNDHMSNVKELLIEATSLIAPTLLVGMIRGMWRRIENDPRVLDAARTLFLREVREVIGEVV